MKASLIWPLVPGCSVLTRQHLHPFSSLSHPQTPSLSGKKTKSSLLSVVGIPADNPTVEETFSFLERTKYNLLFEKLKTLTLAPENIVWQVRPWVHILKILVHLTRCKKARDLLRRCHRNINGYGRQVSWINGPHVVLGIARYVLRCSIRRDVLVWTQTYHVTELIKLSKRSTKWKSLVLGLLGCEYRLWDLVECLL